MTDTATTITPKPTGPLLVQGPARILAPDGTELAVPPRKDGRPSEVVVLCRCGGSATKPFCDGTHKRIGFCDTPPPPSPAPTPGAAPPSSARSIMLMRPGPGGRAPKVSSENPNTAAPGLRDRGLLRCRGAERPMGGRAACRSPDRHIGT